MSDLGSLIVGKPQFLDNSGAPLNGGKLNAYEAGTTTRQDTYSDSSLSTANTNPVVLDSAGRASIFLKNAAYKFVLTDSSDVTIWSLDNVYPPAYVASQAVVAGIPSICQGRLTLTSNTPVTTSDVTAATTVYFTPYKGNGIGLYDGTTWQLVSFSQKSLSISGFTASLPFDVWGYLDSGALAIESTAWTSDSARATALTTQDGIYVKSGDATRRYLGTCRTTSTTGQTEDSAVKRYCWNYYNRVARPMTRLETGSWTYTTNTWRQANASTANQLDVVVGVAEVEMVCSVLGSFSNTNAGVFAAVAIGADSTSAPASNCIFGIFHTDTAAFQKSPTAALRVYPAIGRHFYAWLEVSAASGTTTWRGTQTSTSLINQSGLVGSIDG